MIAVGMIDESLRSNRLPFGLAIDIRDVTMARLSRSIVQQSMLSSDKPIDSRCLAYHFFACHRYLDD